MNRCTLILLLLVTRVALRATMRLTVEHPLLDGMAICNLTRIKDWSIQDQLLR